MHPTNIFSVSRNMLTRIVKAKGEMKKTKIGKHGFNCATRKSAARGCCLSEPTRAGRYHSELTYYLSDANRNKPTTIIR